MLSVESSQSDRDEPTKKMTFMERKNYNKKKFIIRNINQFIAQLYIPVYGNVTHYYYYDVLEALSRSLFTNLIRRKRV